MLFTDIEGSTVLLDRLGPAYRDVLSLQRRVIRDVVTTFHGHEMGTEGDSFFVVFARAADGVLAAVAAQRALSAAAWPGGGQVSVRMGLHTGEPERHEDGYVGMDVHRAARVAASARGGQIIATAATWGVASGHVDGVEVEDLGWHRLKDIRSPERLYRIRAPDLADVSAGVRSLGSVTGLPTPQQQIVGREPEMAEVERLVTAGRRLVTLLGPGGVGKTRLSLELAGRLAGAAPDGVFFVPLAEATTSEEFWGHLVEVVGDPADLRGRQGVLDALAHRRVLLVLDNLEQLAEAAEDVAALVAAGPGVNVLATSRTPLRLMAEQVLPLEPLPNDQAAQLYAERVSRVRPDLDLLASPEDAAAVAELCRRVDGLPLAVELLAARSRLLGPRAMLRRLDEALDVRGTSSDRPSRQQSLRETLDWSWQLLGPEQSRAMARLGAFAGPFTLADAAAVLERTPDDTVDLLFDLVDASMVRAADAATGEPEFRLLLIIARYAAGRLAEDGQEEVRARSLHAQQVNQVVTLACGWIRGPRHIAALDLLAQQRSNIAAALDWTLRPASEQLVVGLEIVRRLAWYWYSSDRQSEGRRWLVRAREISVGVTDPEATKAAHGLGVMLAQEGRYDEAREMLQECLTAARLHEDREAIGRESNSLGVVEHARGNYEQARAHFAVAIDLAREDDAGERLSNALNNLAALEAEEGRHQVALDLLEEVLAIDLAAKDAWGIGVDRLNIAGAHLRAGSLDLAQEQFGRYAEAMLSLADVEVDAELLENLTILACRRGVLEAAASALGAADQVRKGAGVPRMPALERELDTCVTPAREGLDAQAWSRAAEQGRSQTVREVVRQVLDRLGPVPGDPH